MKKIIKNNWDEFLREYYHQKCKGCPKGHNSFWKTIIESKEWKDWKLFNELRVIKSKWDFSDCEELGILSPSHWHAFIRFLILFELNKRGNR